MPSGYKGNLMSLRMITLGFAVAALLPPAAFGAKQKVEQVLVTSTQAQFDEAAAHIRHEMNAGGRYEFLRPNERETIEHRLKEIGDMLDHNADGSFTRQEKLKLLNAQEEVNGLLAQRDGNRLICERRAPTGSHLQQNTCVTYAEKERERRETQKLLRDRGAVVSEEHGT